MSDGDHYSLFSIIFSGISSTLLFTSSWQIPALLMLLWSFFFISKLRKTQKLKPPEDFKVIIIGAGASGICMGKKLNDLGIKYTILEKDASLGGTWYENTYPGCACDIPSHLYSFSFYQNPNWSRAYSRQKEIFEYMKLTATRFDVYPHIKFGMRIKLNQWNKETNKWTVETEAGDTFVSNIVVSGCGSLHVPKMPEILGIDDFKGECFHTAQWKPDYDPKGKKIAVIGTGASAVQCVPNLAKMGVEELTVFQRTPCWSPPRHDFEYPELVKTLFNFVPLTNTIHRYYFFLHNEILYRIIFAADSWFTKRTADIAQWIVRKHIKKVVMDPKLATKLTPDFKIGCKRATPSDYYLQCFNSKNVHLVTDKIKSVTEEGILMSDGCENKFDTIVFATGFDVEKSVRAFEQTGLNTDSRSVYYAEYPSAYLGITHPNHPNFFILNGPNTGLGHNSLIYMIECQANYVCDGILKMIESGAKSIVVKPEVLKNFNDFIMENMKGKVFADNTCGTGWYWNKDGVNWTLWPLDLISYWWYTLSLNPEDYKFKY